ncbi:MAG TPA: hypothetical protein VFY80_01285, partial [Burkholderiales bacterium]|nr:hypothetical protein [Burkholderiales bacterium]
MGLAATRKLHLHRTYFAGRTIQRILSAADRFPASHPDAGCGTQRGTVIVLRSLWMLAAACALSALQSASAQDADALRARHAALAGALSSNPFQRPLHIESAQATDALRGDVYARLEQPHQKVANALADIDQWCDILILHLNVKSCRRSHAGSATTLVVLIGRKYDQRPEQAYRVDFLYRIAAATPDYLRVVLNAESGPLGTKDYRIVLQAAALDAQRTFVQLSYSYSYG